MRLWIVACLALLPVVLNAYADILPKPYRDPFRFTPPHREQPWHERRYADIPPTPDRGPAQGSAGGLNFAVQWEQYEMGPVNGPHYWKSRQVVALVGCIDGQPNCTLARAKKLIGMDVAAVDGEELQPEKGMVRQILDAFQQSTAGPTVTLELYAHGSNDSRLTVAFARD